MHLSEKIVASARSWIGTRFHHQGRLKKTDTHKGGVDCLGVLVGVARELELKDKSGSTLLWQADDTRYDHYPDGEYFSNRLRQLLQPIELTELASGDIVLFTMDGNPQHVAIVATSGGNMSIIHAYAQCRCVTETFLDAYWRSKLTEAFRVT